jgi:hypothetical protein
MNEFENKLRGLPFREPPADLRRSVLAAAETPHEASWTWLDWLWPAPLAWAALVLMLAAAWTADALTGVASERKAVVTVEPQASSPALFAFQPRGRQVAWLETFH